MQEPLRKSNKAHEVYFQRKVRMNHRLDNAATSQVSRSTEPLLEDSYTTPAGLHNDLKAKRKLSRFEMVWLLSCSIVSVIILIVSMMIRVDMIEQTRSIENLQDVITNYQQHTDVIKSEIADQYNYDTIKGIAIENGMTVSKDRVRTIE